MKNYNPLYNPSSKLETVEVADITIPTTYGQNIIESTARNPVYSASSTQSRGSTSSISSVGSNPFTRGQIELTKTNKAPNQYRELTGSRESTVSVPHNNGVNTNKAPNQSTKLTGSREPTVRVLPNIGANNIVVPPSYKNKKNKPPPKIQFNPVPLRPKGGKRSSKTRKQRKNRK